MVIEGKKAVRIFLVAVLIILEMGFLIGTVEASWYDPGKDYYDTPPWEPLQGQVAGEWTWDQDGGHLTKTGTCDFTLVSGQQSEWAGGANIQIEGVFCRGSWNDSYTTPKPIQINLTIANYEVKDLIKYVWLSYKTYGNYTSTYGDGHIGYTGSATLKKSGAGAPVNGWTPRYELWEFDWQPMTETFKFNWLLPPSQAGPPLVISYAGIKDVKYSTLCVPEPATIVLLGLGGLALLRRRTRAT